MENSATKKIFINEEMFGQVNSITITGKIEIATSKQGNYFVSELIFLSFTNAYDTSSTVNMKIKGFDVYNLSAALTKILEKGSSDYKKFTDSSKSKNTYNNNKKFISLKLDEKDNSKVFINLVSNSEDNSNKYNVISNVSFEKYEVPGIIKTLDTFMSNYKQYFYKCQRAYEKLNQAKAQEEKIDG